MASGSAPVTRKRRTTSSTTTADPQLGFVSADAAKSYTQDFCLRKIIYGKIFDQALFSSGGLTVDALFQTQGITNFLLTNEKVYVKLLRQFYANLYYPQKANGTYDTTRIHSIILNRGIVITKDLLRQALHLPSEGTYTLTSDFSTINSYSRDVAIQQLKGRNYIPHQTFIASMMNPTCRIIHHIIGYCILPRSGSRNNVSQIELFLVCVILNGHKIDYADLILSHLFNLANTRNAGLAYGMAFTRILTHLKINLATETDVYSPQPTDWYSARTIHQMGYTRDANTIWVPKGQGKEQASDDDADIEPNVQPLHPPIDARLNLIIELLNQTNTKLDTFRDITRVELRELNAKLDSFTSDYYAHFPQPQ